MLNHWNIKRHNDVDDHTLLTAVQNVVDESSGQLGYRDVTEKIRYTKKGMFLVLMLKVKIFKHVNENRSKIFYNN